MVPWVRDRKGRLVGMMLTLRRLQELARRHPDSIQVLSTRAFFWPLWSGEEIQHIHENDDYDFYGTGQYA